MKKTIVLMKSDHGSQLAMEADDVTGWEKLDWVAISEPVEVEFPELSNEVVVNKQIAVLDKKIQQVMAESEATLNQLKARKQELLAICYEPVEKDDED